MCGIIGFMDRGGASTAPVGRHLLRMLSALGSRGPDSAGVAIFGPGNGDLILRVKLEDDGDSAETAGEVLRRASSFTTVRDHLHAGSYLRLAVDGAADLPQLIHTIECATQTSPYAHTHTPTHPHTHSSPHPHTHTSPHPLTHSPTHPLNSTRIEVVSAGRRLEIVKQVGSPENLEATYGISRMLGTHGLGHTRLSTESRVDLSHSQPFWARGVPDLAVVHNGHITNYHRLRRLYEQRGVRFCTENDSEIIGVYLRGRLSGGDTLEEALRASLTDLDGSFSYLAAAEGVLALVKDPYGLKPLVVAETHEWVAIATEETALRQAFGEDFAAREAGAATIQVWKPAPDREPAVA